MRQRVQQRPAAYHLRSRRQGLSTWQLTGRSNLQTRVRSSAGLGAGAAVEFTRLLYFSQAAGGKQALCMWDTARESLLIYFSPDAGGNQAICMRDTARESPRLTNPLPSQLVT